MFETLIKQNSPAILRGCLLNDLIIYLFPFFLTFVAGGVMAGA